MAQSPPPIYDTIGVDYNANRQAEPAWGALIAEHLGDARRVANVGAGTGCYEPSATAATAPSAPTATPQVVAVEPSAVMIAQRRPGAAPAIRGSGSALPLLAGSLDAVTAILTIHHWDDWSAGLAELQRVAPRRLIVTIDFAVHARFWLLADYLPEVADYVLAPPTAHRRHRRSTTPHPRPSAPASVQHGRRRTRCALAPPRGLPRPDSTGQLLALGSG